MRSARAHQGLSTGEKLFSEQLAPFELCSFIHNPNMLVFYELSFADAINDATIRRYIARWLCCPQ